MAGGTDAREGRCIAITLLIAAFAIWLVADGIPAIDRWLRDDAIYVMFTTAEGPEVMLRLVYTDDWTGGDYAHRIYTGRVLEDERQIMRDAWVKSITYNRAGTVSDKGWNYNLLTGRVEMYIDYVPLQE